MWSHKSQGSVPKDREFRKIVKDRDSTKDREALAPSRSWCHKTFRVIGVLQGFWRTWQDHLISMPRVLPKFHSSFSVTPKRTLVGSMPNSIRKTCEREGRQKSHTLRSAKGSCPGMAGVIDMSPAKWKPSSTAPIEHNVHSCCDLS